MGRRIALGCVVLFLLAVGGVAAWLWSPAYYYAESIEGTVVDETGAPVPGAVVTAIWCLEGGHTSCRPFHISETSTDARGKYRIPPMSRKWRRNPLLGLRAQDPHLIIYRDRYEILHLTNQNFYYLPIRTVRNGRVVATEPSPPGTYAQKHRSDYSREARRISYWNGRTVTLKYAPDIAARAKSVEDAELWSNRGNVPAVRLGAVARAARQSIPHRFWDNAYQYMYGGKKWTP